MQIVGEEDLKAAVSARKRLGALYAALCPLYLAAVLVLFFLSPHAYTWYMVGNILLTLLFGGYSVYFFTVRFFDARCYEKYVERVVNAISAKEYGVFLRREGTVTKEGVSFEALIFTVRGDEREILSVKRDLPFTAGEKYVLEVSAGVLTKYEVTDGTV